MRDLKRKRDELIFIAGPCVIENQKLTMDIASCLKDITKKLPVRFIFKASFDKANRTSVKSFRGPGLIKGLKILEKVKREVNVSVLSDIHSPGQVKLASKVLDVIQIPAFLCRQTDLIIEAAKTKKMINIKKGQFVAPADLQYAIEKIRSTGNKRILITERGTCFGYNNLVVDFRSFLIMKKFGFPVIFDVTHSLQRPSAKGGISGGDSEFIEPLAKAGVASGINGIFMEVHPKPKMAQSDKHTSYPLAKVEGLLKKILAVKAVI